MNRTDLNFTANAEGYMLIYKGKNIGGASILGRYKGRRRTAQIREYAQTATREVEAILGGRGQARFLQTIAKIDEEKETRIAKAFGMRTPEESREFEAVDPDDSTAAENNHTAPDEARHVPTANNPHAEGFDATCRYCIEEKQTADRYHADSLLARVVGAQTAYWNRLRELEQLLGFEIDSTQDLRETDLDTILANPGAPV